MKKLFMSVLLATFAMNAFCNFCEAPTAALKAKELYLIVQSTHRATIKDGKIILHDVMPYATAFTQRPIRKVELITLNNLLRLWNPANPNGFTKNPPNAAINASMIGSDSKEHVTFFVQLLDSTYDSKNQTLTYRFKELDGSPTTIPKNVNLGNVNLFIDDICLDCWWPS